MNRSFLVECEREQLHSSGAIQSHGTLLVVAADGRIVHAASNVAEYLGESAQELLGQNLPPAFRHLSDAVPNATGSRRTYLAGMKGQSGLLDLSMQRIGNGHLLLELTATGQSPTPKAGHLDSFADEDSLALARQRLLEDTAEVCVARRLMYYAFNESGDGEVINEVRLGESYGSYLGQRFPASDIPLIARQLYLKNPWRLIPDARLAPIPVLGLTSQPPDLTYSDLRSVSPVHLVYLGNMGVVGSLSFPVIVAGVLVALIAVHHNEPLNLSLGLLQYLSDRVKQFNLSLVGYRAQSRMRMIDGLTRRFDGLRGVLRRHGNLVSAWPELAPMLLEEFSVDGAVLCDGSATVSVGQGFEAQALGVFDEWFCNHQNDLVWLGDSLGLQVPGYPLSHIAGALALRLPLFKGLGIRVYLTRREHIDEVAWGGNPDKPVEVHDGVLGIAPRRSFERWVETRMGHCHPWENETRLLGLKLRDWLLAEVHH